MNIVYSSSDYYSECTGISLYSLYENNKKNEVDAYILSSGISEVNKKKLHDVADKFGRKLTIIEADEGFKEAAKKYDFERMRGSYNTYARIILNKWLSFLDKVIVIDSDSIVCDNLQEMWDTDIEDYFYAAVPEVSMYGKYNYFEDQDIIWEHPIYYNAGICIVNLKKWREENIDDYLIEKVKNDGKSYLNSEQSIMNKFLGDKIKRIPLKYNFYTTFHFADFSTVERIFYKKKLIDKEEYLQAKNKPAIIHYCGFSYERPWFKKSVAYKKKEYLETRQKTGWGDTQLKKWSNRESKFKNIYDIICYLLIKIHAFNLCLRFRLVFAQKMKGFLSKV